MFNIRSEDYIHCDGTQLKLTDSDLGSEQYTTSDYYVWTAGSKSTQLLFIYPTRVNLTTITLHYYSDSVRGLSSLRFYAVPDDFDVRDAPTSSYNHAEIAAVPLRGEPAGHSIVYVCIDFNNTMKILLYKYDSTYSLAVSEVEFFNDSCSSLQNITATTLSGDSVKTIANIKNTLLVTDVTQIKKSSGTIGRFTYLGNTFLYKS